MIGNRFLRELYGIADENQSLCQLLEYLTYRDQEFLDSLESEPVDPDSCNSFELQYLTKASALIDYFLQLHRITVPSWLRDDKLTFETPYYYSKRLTDFEKFRLIYTSPGPFRRRNVFFELEGLRRV